MEFARYVAEQSVSLSTVEPGAALDDLEPLAERLAGARVVAVGENAHLVREFYLMRHRVHRFLAERLGFTVYAMESGFSEGLSVDAWVRGERAADELRAVADSGITYTMGQCPEMREHLTWMRTGGSGLRFFGVDVPGSTASALPGLDGVRRYLREVDPEAESVVARLAELVGKYAGEHAVPAYRAYLGLGVAERDRMTAIFAELAARFDALDVEYRSASGAEAHAVARHELRLAVLLDQAMRGYAAQVTSDGGSLAAHPRMTVRDRGMAETVFWLLERFGPDVKVVVAAANSHIQRTPVQAPGGPLSVMGHHLADRLGSGYLAMGMTCSGGRTVTHRADAARPGGVAIVGADLVAPEEGSVEAAMAGKLCAVDLRAARGGGVSGAPDRVRILDRYQPTAVLDAYDLMINVPEVRPAGQVTEPGNADTAAG